MPNLFGKQQKFILEQCLIESKILININKKKQENQRIRNFFFIIIEFLNVQTIYKLNLFKLSFGHFVCQNHVSGHLTIEFALINYGQRKNCALLNSSIFNSMQC